MKNEKKHPRKQLEKYSNIFMQLSLVLVLFVVYQLIEHETRYNSLAIDVPESSIDYILKVDETPLVQFKKEVKKTIKKSPPKQIILDEIIPKKDNKNMIDEVLLHEDPIEDNKAKIEKALDEYIPEDKDPDEDVDFIIIEDAPIYKGCEGLSKEENKKCFIKSIQKFVVKRFNVNLAQDLGLAPGKYKIFAQFVIAKDGNITEIKIKAPHSKLKKEVNTIIKKMPKFTPGMQRKVPVNVKFTLPISFNVE
jgi:protein TonB